MLLFTNLSDWLNQGPKLTFRLGQLILQPSYINLGLIIGLLFFLVLVLSQIRRHFMNWSVKGSLYGFGLGFALALVIEGLLMVFGSSLLAALMGIENIPKPLSVLIESLRHNLSNVVCR